MGNVFKKPLANGDNLTGEKGWLNIGNTFFHSYSGRSGEPESRKSFNYGVLNVKLAISEH